MDSASQAIRKSFLSLFTRKALNTYIQCQDGVIRRHISEWLAQHSDQELDVKRIVRSAAALCCNHRSYICQLTSQVGKVGKDFAWK